MSIQSQKQIVTADELFSMSVDGYRLELIKGSLNMMSPAGGRHGRLANLIAYLLTKHVSENALGQVYAAETGFKIESNPDTVLAPDVAFVHRANLGEIVDDTGFMPIAPDFVVEVLSPNDRFSRVEAKALTWMNAGTKLVLLVDPEAQLVHSYSSRQQIAIFQVGEIVDCSTAVEGFQLNLSQLFA
jgi:Uma2 family endonuclease